LEDHDGAALATRVADEELTPRATELCSGLAHEPAFEAACATVSRSANPSIRTIRLPGGRRTSTAGSWIAPYFRLSASTSELLTSTATNAAPAMPAPAAASRIAVASMVAFGA